MPCVIAIIPIDNGEEYKYGDVVQAFDARINKDGQVEVQVGVNKDGSLNWITSLGDCAHREFFIVHDPKRSVVDYCPEELPDGNAQKTNIDLTAAQLPYTMEQIKDVAVSIPIIKLSEATTDQLYAAATDRIIVRPKRTVEEVIGKEL